jgi:arylsulfatase A-like enzyme
MLISAKMLFYEHSLRIPMVFMGPGIRQNSSFDEWLGTQVDLAPSVLALAGIDAPAWMDGRSVIPLLVSPQVVATGASVIKC